MILVKNILCLSKKDVGKVFNDVVVKKKIPLQDIRKNCYKKRKTRTFPKGLFHHLGQKFKISSTLIFMQNQPTKSIWEHST